MPLLSQSLLWSCSDVDLQADILLCLRSLSIFYLLRELFELCYQAAEFMKGTDPDSSSQTLKDPNKMA